MKTRKRAQVFWSGNITGEGARWTIIEYPFWPGVSHVAKKGITV